MEKCKPCLDRAGVIGLDFSSPVFVLWASWEALAAKLFPRTIQKDTSTGTFDDFFRFFEIRGCPEASLWGNFLSFFLIIFEVKKNIDFGALWAGAGGRGRGSSKLQILRF